jgi:hypothetical protein
MFEENYRNEKEQKHKELIARFDEMYVKKECHYFDVEELEQIIDHFLNEGQRKKIQKAIEISDQLFPFSIDLKIKKAQVLIAYDEASYALNLLKKN